MLHHAHQPLAIIYAIDNGFIVYLPPDEPSGSPFPGFSQIVPQIVDAAKQMRGAAGLDEGEEWKGAPDATKPETEDAGPIYHYCATFADVLEFLRTTLQCDECAEKTG